VISTVTLRGTSARRVLGLLMALAVLMLPVALPVANAEPDYVPVFYKITADTFAAKVGGKIAFTAQTFKGGSAVGYDVVADGASVTSGSTTADAKGIARQTITFTVAGKNTVTMSGTSDKGEPLSLSAKITVTDDGSGGGDTAGDPQADEGGVPFLGGGLPRTGGDIAVTVLIGMALLGGGAALVVATRRRRNS